MTILIYGAYGYSGRLISEEAHQQGLDIVLAGRNESELAPLAESLGADYLVFSLDDPTQLRQALESVSIVIHCAGPFSATAKPMIDACIAAQTHYLDITGEIDVFEYAHSAEVDQKATEAGIILCPGVGFDVIPTDCVAARLKEALPDASELTLAFSGGDALSPGTAKTMLESLAHGLKIRQEGKIINANRPSRMIDFGSGECECVAISWGDVSTAYHSTGIPNIHVYTPSSKRTKQLLTLLDTVKPVLKIQWLQQFLKNKIEQRISGPNSNVRSVNPATIYGEARNSSGKTVCARLKTLNGYDVTRYGAVYVAHKLLVGTFSQTGSVTPSLLMGSELASRLPGSSPITLFD